MLKLETHEIIERILHRGCAIVRNYEGYLQHINPRCLEIYLRGNNVVIGLDLRAHLSLGGSEAYERGMYEATFK